MPTGKLVIALFALALGFAVATGAHAAGVAPPNDAVSTASEAVTGARFCPIRILCKQGTVARCHYNTHRHHCVCRCVPRE
jgi:hypothetical protein